MISLILSIVLLASCSSEKNIQEKLDNRLVGGPCEGCEGVFEFDNNSINNVDTVFAFDSSKSKLEISGLIMDKKGNPAKDVVLYYYHTDFKGIYDNILNQDGWANRHGSYRGWVKTNEDGRYTIYTIKPESYPNTTTAAHIHLTILEPDGKYYYIEDIYFDGDPFLTEREISPTNPRGIKGSGVLLFELENGIWKTNHNIVLGLNVY